MTEKDPTAKKSPERRRARKQLLALRNMERDPDIPMYTNTRGGEWIVEDFRGLQRLFEYVRTLSSRVVVDVGTGTGYGIGQIANSRIGEGLEFQATRIAEPKNMIGIVDAKVRVRRTSIEGMRGFLPGSIGRILGNFSIGYAEPSLAVASIDRLLVPGGAVKMTLARKDSDNDSVKIWGFKESGIFAEKLKTLGYDVHEEPDLFNRSMVLAIKAGGTGGTSARELYERDAASEQEQKKSIASDSKKLPR